MKFVYVLEDDSRFQQEMTEAIRSTYPQMELRFFTDLAQLEKWINIADGPSAIAKAGVNSFPVDGGAPSDGKDELSLLIFKYEFGLDKKFQLIPFLEKARELFIQKKICTAENPTGFLLTAFDDPHFKSKPLHNKIINNIIFKPFDKMLLGQHLIYAMDGRHPPSKQSMASQKTTAIVEMLKDIELEEINEMGFSTKSYLKIEVGASSKYYSDLFKSDRHRSVVATCTSCEPHPQDKEHFYCTFKFFAIDQTQISQIRKNCRTQGKKSNLPDKLAAAGAVNHVNIVMIDKDETSDSGFAGTLKRKFSNAQVFNFEDLELFLKLTDAKSAEELKKNPAYEKMILPDRIDVVVLSDEFLGESGVEKWEGIEKLILKREKQNSVKPKLYLLTKKDLSDKEEMDFTTYVDDIFSKPVDKSYGGQKFKFSFPELNLSDSLEVYRQQIKTIIKVATPIVLSELSEAGFVMQYHRAISLGAFREMVLWQPYEIGAPELQAACNFAEPAAGQKDTFNCHFVFFGMTDFFLKHIRVWIRNNYVQSKEQSAS